MTKARAIVLGSIQAVGVISFGLLLPKLTSTLIRMEKRSEEKARGVVSRLQKQGLIKISHAGISLTPAGELYLSRHRAPARPRTWDGKWRVVIFDIPEHRRIQRTLLRRALRDTGFSMLQDSVWVYPFDCEELIALLKLEFRIGKEVLYMIADAIENDSAMKRRFNLP